MSAPEPLSAERRAELRAVAEAATPERWAWKCLGEQDNSWGVCTACEGDSDIPIAGSLDEWESERYDGGPDMPEWDVVDYICESHGDTGPLANAAHIAAFDPPTVLALLDQADEAVRLAWEVERLRAALEWFIDDEACWFDHRGYCQAHGSLVEGPCRMVVARAALTPPEEDR